MKAAKSVVEIWQWGGPSQLESFDPKPKASRDYNGGLKAIPTNVPGVEIHEWWPELAKCADLYSVIRSMTHDQFGHESAAYLMQTGRLPGGGSWGVSSRDEAAARFRFFVDRAGVQHPDARFAPDARAAGFALDPGAVWRPSVPHSALLHTNP